MTASSSESLIKKIVNTLKEVYDPEIPISIWDLGLIYDVKVTDDGTVNIKMTLTAPGCPIANMIVHYVREAVRNIDGVKDVNIELVFDPPWDPTKMTPEGRERFKELFGYDIVEEYKRKLKLMFSDESKRT